MDFLGFTLSVWAAIGVGVLFIALVVACNFDRDNRSAPKWIVFTIGLIAFCAWQWDNLSLDSLTNAALWAGVAWYLVIGFVYSIVEFVFTVRRESRQVASEWDHFKKNHSVARDGRDNDGKTLEQKFVERSSYRSSRVIALQVEDGNLVPSVQRSELAQAIGCWTLFWPGYAVSLVLGDLLTEIFRKVADVLAALSTGFVKRTFARAFKQA